MDKSMIRYLLIMIICGFHVQFSKAQSVSIKSNSFGYFLGCKTCKTGWWATYPCVFTADNDNTVEALWQVVNVDVHTIALKSRHGNTYLSVQPGM